MSNTDLQIRKPPALMQSLPLRLAKLASSIGTTKWAGQPVRLNLPSGVVLSNQDRSEISARLNGLTEIITCSNLSPIAAAKARLALLTRMLLALSVGSMSE